MTELTERELDRVIEAAHPSRPDREALTRAAVEAILTTRLARVEALADEWERVGGPSRVAFLVAADELRTALAAPTPTEVQS